MTSTLVSVPQKADSVDAGHRRAHFSLAAVLGTSLEGRLLKPPLGRIMLETLTTLAAPDEPVKQNTQGGRGGGRTMFVAHS